VTVALITEPDANPGETEYLAAQLSGDGIKTLRVPGPGITLDNIPPLVTLVVIAPDGTWLATVSNDRTIRI
jgi:hypothetical protein